VNSLTAELLELCDGRRTGREVVDEVAEGMQARGAARRERLTQRTIAALCRLREVGAVGLRPPAPAGMEDGERTASPGSPPPSGRG
jgi:hypothetical protein